MEYREFRAGSIAEGDDGKLILRVAPFNSLTTIGDKSRGGWDEEIAPGCFTKALREGDTVLLCDHDMSKPISRMSAGTLRLSEGKTHLEGDADPVDTSYVRDLRANIKAGNKGGMSIGFVPVKDEWFDDEGQPSNRMVGTRRVLREVKLPEASIVTNPAYKDTAVFARDDSAALLEERAGNPKPYGDVKYADEKNGKYPVDTEEHARAAWSYINMPKNAAKYPLNGVSLEGVKAKIKAALKHFGIKVEAKSEDDDAELRDPYADEFYETESRDDPDGKEYAAIDEALRALRKSPPDIKGALASLRERQGQRDDPDGEEFRVIDRAIRLLEETPPDVKGAKNELSMNQMMRRDSDQEPESSTPENDEDQNIALREAWRRAEDRSRELGIV